MESTGAVTITLDPSEAQFLVTVLKASTAILTTIMGLQQSMPGLSPPSIRTEAIANVAALAEKIEQRISMVL